MFGINIIKNILINVNATVTKCVEGSDRFQKIVTTSTGTVAMGKGAVDMIEDLACQDYVCFTVDCIGVVADGLTSLTSFIPGPNVTSVVTIPISLGCKTFRWCCKRAELPFGCRK